MDLEKITMTRQYFWRSDSQDTGSFGLLMSAGDYDANAATPATVYFTGYDGRTPMLAQAALRRGYRVDPPAYIVLVHVTMILSPAASSPLTLSGMPSLWTFTHLPIQIQ